VRLALLAQTGEPGYASALTTPEWGFEDALFRGQRITLPRSLGCYVMENVLFKARYPAEFHAQTAVECGVELHPLVAGRLDEIERIEISTQESAIRIISKTGPLRNPADRDHCLQYMVAVALLKGDLTADDYADAAASDPRIDALRERMRVTEDPEYTREYLDPAARSIANAAQVFFSDGSATPRVEVRFPIGHRRRRAEARPYLLAKFAANIGTRLPARRCERLLALWHDPDALATLPVNQFMDALAL
jgi:2-methylcitrate dehydratase